MPSTARAFGGVDKTSPLGPLSVQRRDPGPRDVEYEILYCGVCHSDIHTVRAEWPGTVYPCVPGHEIVGRVTKVGKEVKGFKVGDLAATGCMVDSCKSCPSCKAGLEQYCDTGRHRFHLQLGRPGHQGPADLRRIFRPHRRRRTVLSARLRQIGPESGRPAAVCGDHPLFAVETLAVPGRAKRSAWSASAGSGTWA